MAPNTPEKLPVAANLEVIQARIELAIAKRDAIVKSWVDKFDTSRCAPSKTKEEIEAWDAELFNPMPSNLGLGAPIPKEYLNGDINRKDISGNSKLRSLMLGKKAGLQAAKPRNAEEKASSMKRGLKEDTSDEEAGRSNLGKSKKAKRELAKQAAARTTETPQPAKQTKPLPLQQKTRTSSGIQAVSLGENNDDSRTTLHAFKADNKPKNAKNTQKHLSSLDLSTSEPSTTQVLSMEMPPLKVDAGIEIAAKPIVPSEPISTTLSEAEARREKNRLKKEKKKERKRKEKEQALAEASVAKNNTGEK